MKNETYEEFVEKFKPKLTTDDCMTPPQVYDAVRDWVCRKYGVIPEKIIRPFWPGGDYENFAYPNDCIVLDRVLHDPVNITSRYTKRYCDEIFLFADTASAVVCQF